MSDITQTELDQPKEITEGAILQLINHWLMEYKPELTLDPTSQGIPTSQAVAAYVAGAGRNARTFTFSDNLDTGFFVDFPEDILNSIMAKKALEIMFVPTYNGVIGNGLPPLFAQNIFYLERYDLAETVTKGDYVQNPLTHKTACLMWIFMNDDDQRVAMLYRHVTLVRFHHPDLVDNYTKGTYLYISALRRSVIGSNSVTVNQNPTAAQKARCRIARAITFI